MISRGDVVYVRFPFTDGGAKVRPAVVIQNDRYNTLLRKTVVAMVTGNLSRASDPAHLLVDPATPDGAGSGLLYPSLVSCNNLHTIEQLGIHRTVGRLSDPLLQRLDQCLKEALKIS